MRQIRVLIVDDEPLARKTLRLLLEKDNDVEITGECRDGNDAVKQIAQKKPDVVFLDVQMPRMSGFDVIRAVGVEKMPLTVFVTAHDTYAVKAFEAQAFDYLLKPFEDARFERTLRRAKAALERLDVSSLTGRLSALLDAPRSTTREQPAAKRLLIHDNSKVIFLNPEDINWIGAADYYAEIHTQKKTYIQRETMDQLEKKLAPAQFARIHRSTIVNRDIIKEIQPTQNGNYIVLLQDGTELKLSRRRREQIKHML